MADIFQMTFSNVFFLNENIWISNTISLKFVPKGPIDNNTALVQIMAWRYTGNKTLSEPMMAEISGTYPSLSLNELRLK